MPLIKDTPPPASKSYARIQAAAWVFIYSGLLIVITGITVARNETALGWAFIVLGSLATAIGAGLIYIRSRMK